MRIGLVQSEPAHLDLETTCKRLEPQLAACASDGADLIILPELAGSGYSFPDRESLIKVAEPSDGSGPFLGWIKERCSEFGCSVVTGYAEAGNNHLYNSAALVSSNGVCGNYRKLHLFDREPELFTPGNLGVPIFTIKDAKFSILICFDWAFPEVWRMAALAGADFIAHPSNLVLPWAQTATKGHALCNRIFVFTANRIGSEGELHFTGASQALDPNADILANAPTDSKWQQVFAISPEDARDKQAGDGVDLFSARRPEIYDQHI